MKKETSWGISLSYMHSIWRPMVYHVSTQPHSETPGYWSRLQTCLKNTRRSSRHSLNIRKGSIKKTSMPHTWEFFQKSTSGPAVNTIKLYLNSGLNCLIKILTISKLSPSLWSSSRSYSHQLRMPYHYTQKFPFRPRVSQQNNQVVYRKTSQLTTSILRIIPLIA